MVIMVGSYASTSSKQKLPVKISRELPHLLLQLSVNIDPHSPHVHAMYDSGSGFKAVDNYNFFSAVAKIDPSVVKAIYAKDYEKIGLSGCVKNDDGLHVTTDLTVVLNYLL